MGPDHGGGIHGLLGQSAVQSETVLGENDIHRPILYSAGGGVISKVVVLS